MTAGAFAAPKMPAKGTKMTAAQCSAACTQHMKAKGMKGSCSIAACKSGACPMMGKMGKTAPKAHPKAKK
jgi:hypothetical protein